MKGLPVGSNKTTPFPQQVDRLDGIDIDNTVRDLIAPLDQIVDAHRYLESNQQVGKVVVTV